VKDRSPRI